MTLWKEVRLGDACRITRGASPRPIIEWVAPVGIPWIKISDASAEPGRVIRKTSEFIRADGASRSVRVVPGDLIVSNSATPGVPKFVGIDACIHDGWLLVRDFHGIDPYFLFYRICVDREALLSQGNGSVFTNLKTEILKNHRVPLPPLPTQRAIAEVLGALDDKIAADGEVAACALRLAALLFSRLPSSEERGLKYGELADIFGGGTPSTKQGEFWGGPIPWATPTDITALGAPYLDSTSRTISAAGLAACASRLYEPGSILMTSRATIGAFALAKVATAVNQGFIVVQAHDPRTTLWLFHEMQTRVDEYIAHANGATFLELSRGRFKDLPLAVPVDKGVIYRFGEQVGPLHERAYQATLESRRLAELRDTLLPALMSGRVSVREAEATVGAAL